MPNFGRRLGELYDDYRTACLSRKYYGRRLASMKRANLWYEIALALATSSALVAAITNIFSQHSVGARDLTACIPGVAAILAVLKPVLGWEKEIERLSKLAGGYSEIFEQLRIIVAEVHLDEAISDRQQWTIQNLKSAMAKLSAAEDSNPSSSILEKLQCEVHKEIPRDSLWYPPSTPGGTHQSDNGCAIASAL